VGSFFKTFVLMNKLYFNIESSKGIFMSFSAIGSLFIDKTDLKNAIVSNGRSTESVFTILSIDTNSYDECIIDIRDVN
jgi:hypothetical protein